MAKNLPSFLPTGLKQGNISHFRPTHFLTRRSKFILPRLEFLNALNALKKAVDAAVQKSMSVPPHPKFFRSVFSPWPCVFCFPSNKLIMMVKIDLAWGHEGIDPSTTSTLRRYHTTRPMSRARIRVTPMSPSG